MLARIAILLSVLSFSFGTAAIEISTVFVALVCVWRLKKIPSIPTPLLIYGGIALCSIRVVDDVHEVLGKWWLFSPLIFLPPLLSEITANQRFRILLFGSRALAMLALFGCWQSLNGTPGQGWYSHHLSFGYMLLMPLAFTCHFRLWGTMVLVLLGIISTQAQGPLYSSIAVICAQWVSSRLILQLGVIGICGLFWLFFEQAYFQERMVIWESALNLLQEYPFGTGVSRFREYYSVAQSRLDPSFYFPHHAHDSAIQQALWFGIPIWFAWGKLFQDWWTWNKWGRVMLVALILGSFTEDTFGDMEVLRALLVFGCFAQRPLLSSLKFGSGVSEVEKSGIINQKIRQE